MDHYVTKTELSRAVRQSQAAGRMTDELARLISLIATKYAARLIPSDQLDDVVQDVCVSLLVSLDKIDPDDNVFNYVTSTAMNSVRAAHKQRVTFHRLRAAAWDRAARRPPA